MNNPSFNSNERDREQSLEMAVKQALHDIKSPLSALNALLATPAPTNQDQRQMLELISKRIKSIVNDLNTHQRVAARTAQNQIHKIQSYRPLVEIINSISQEKRLEFSVLKEVTIVEDCALTVDESGFEQPLHLESALAGHLQRVISNLMNNALEAESTTIKFRARTERQQIVISIEDDGMGIDPAILKKLAQGEVISHGKARLENDALPCSQGLGLAHASSFVRSLGGRLTIQSEQGKGSSISMWLPIQAFELIDECAMNLG